MADEHEAHAEGEASHGGGGGSHGGHGHGGGGGHEEGHEGAPEWLISFADNVALMMGFFVILLAMEMNKSAAAAKAGPSPDERGEETVSAEMLDWAISVREAFNNPVNINSTHPGEASLVRRLKERAGLLEAADDQGLPGNDPGVQSIRPSDYLGAGGTVRFSRGDAKLDETARRELRTIFDHARGLSCVLEVRGHVSAAESHNQPDRGMSLAYARANSAAAALVELGLPWTRLRLIACGDGERAVATAYDDEGHHTNQRVEIIETDRALPDYLKSGS